MRRTVRALMRLRWRLLVNSLRSGRRRDRFEELSRALAFVFPALLVVLLLGSIVGLTIAGYVGGRGAATGELVAPVVVFLARGVLFGATLLVIVFSIVAPSQTELARHARLRLLPIAPRTLHVAELLAGLVDPWLLAFVPGVLAFGVGLAVGGRPAVGVFAVLVGGLALLNVGLLAALVSFLLAWILKNRQRGELFTVIFVLLLSLLSVLPLLIARRLEPDGPTAVPIDPPAFTIAGFDRGLPLWTVALPSELFGRAMARALEDLSGVPALAVLCLVLEAALVVCATAYVHARILASMESQERRQPQAEAGVRRLHLPFVRPAVSAVALAEMRTAFRSVRGRLVVLWPGPLMALLWAVTLQRPDDPWVTVVATHGYVVFGLGVVFGIHAMQPFTMNLFASDRSGLTLAFLSPMTERDLALGKVLGCLLIFTASTGLCLAAAVAVAPSGSWWLWCATALAGYATFFWLSPVAVVLSALFPVPADLSRTGSGGNPHMLPMFLSLLVLMVLALPGGAILVWGSVWSHRPAATLAAMIGWVGVSAVVGLALVMASSRIVTARRENLALVAHGR